MRYLPLQLAMAASVVGCSTPRGFEEWTDPDLGRAIVSSNPAPPAAVGAAGGEAQVVEATTAAGYVRLVLSRHPSIEAARQRVAAAEARVVQARSLEDPRVMVSPIGEMAETATGMVGLMTGVEQMVPFPGKLGAREAAAASAVDEARMELVRVRSEVARDVKQAYWRHYNAVRALEVTRQSASLLRQVREAADAAYRSGTVSQDDLLRAQMELAAIENDLLTLEQRGAATAGAINALLDRPLHAPLAVPETLEIEGATPPLSQALARAARDNPELAVLRRRVETMRRGVRVATLERRPDLGVGLTYNTVDEEGAMSPTANGEDQWWLTFSFNLPIWGGKYDAMEKEARSEVLAELAGLQARSNELAAGLQMAVTEAQTQERMVRLFRDTLIPQSKQALDVSLSTYRAGRADFPAVVENWRRVLDYEQMYYQAQAELQQMLAEIAALTGEDPLADGAAQEVSYGAE